MQRPSTLVLVAESNGPRALAPATLSQLGKNEEFLEHAIASSPQLLQLENRRSGIRGPYAVFRQLSLPTPSGRIIYPDIVFLTASGHVIVVEVKLGTNPELRNRSVIAQIVDYAASFSQMSEESIVAMFDTDNAAGSWEERVAACFGNEESPDELAAVLMERMQTGELNLVIACDQVPLGLPDVISGIVSVQPLGFDLDLVEITPFTGMDPDELILVPSTRLQTEIVARTAVTIKYQTEDRKPEVSVSATGAATIVDNVRDLGTSRKWTVDEVRDAVNETGSDVDKQLFDFCLRNSYSNNCVSPAQKKIPTFGLNLPFNINGRVEPKMVFYCVLSWDSVALQPGQVGAYAGKAIEEEFRRRLSEVFGSEVDPDRPMPSIPYSTLEPKLMQFLEVLHWLRKELDIPRSS